MAKLGDCISQAQVERCGNNQYPVLSITMQDGLVLQSEKFKKRIASVDTSDYLVIPRGKLVQGIHIDEGNFDVQNLVEAGIVSPAYKVWDINTNRVWPEYLVMYLRSPKAIAYFKTKLIGTVSRRGRMTQSDFMGMQIPLPTIDEQKAIVDKLNKLATLISLRKQQLAKLDELIKSRFIELFGDPIRNTQNRPTTDFINVVKMQRGFDLPVQDRQQDGSIPVFGSNGALDRHNVAKVQGGGVITGRSGTIGTVYYTEGDYWPLNTSLFSVDTHGNNIIYLAYLLQMYELSRFTEGTGVPTLNRNKFHDKPIIDVPLNEQEQFAVFVKQTDKSKLAIHQSLEKLETLKKSLMQKYFG